MEFNQLGICIPILHALQQEGYQKPTPIQERTIPYALKGNDILGLAQTGTGKTAAFAIPTIQRLAKHTNDVNARKIRSLVLTPTRELAMQIDANFKAYGKDLQLKSTVIFGGVKQSKQIQVLQAGVDIVIATPGRLLDLIKQGYVNLDDIEIFILDEADRMLDMGFIRAIKDILKRLPIKKQTMLFSATMPKEINTLVNTLLHNPIKVSITPVSSTVESIQQLVYYVDQVHKIDLLVDFLKQHSNASVLIFTQTKHGANRVVKALAKHRIEALAIHGNKSQVARQKALEGFKQLKIQALVATDIASRGIDIHELQYVVNYDMPNVAETYVHRIGRTGRAGNTGTAISYCNYHEIQMLKDIERLIKKKITVANNDLYPLVDKSEKPKNKQPKRLNKTKLSSKKEQEIEDVLPTKNKKRVHRSKPHNQHTKKHKNSNSTVKKKQHVVSKKRTTK